MISSEELKEIIVSNEGFILNKIGGILPRQILLPPSAIRKVCMLYGVRRSGKSYILFDLFKKQPGNTLYMDFEDERLAGFRAEDFEKLKDIFFELKPSLVEGKNVVFLFDEVQNAPGWERFSRRAVEKEGIAVFATGSSSKMMPKEIHTSLRGRSWGLEVRPFNFCEFIKAKGIDVNDKDFIYGPKRALVKNHFQEYLRFGGFPEIAFLKSEYEKNKVIKEYLDAMFFKDLVERFDIKNIHLLDALKERFFSSFSLKHSLTSFCRQYKDKFPFSKDSVFAYSKYFIESMLIFEVKKFSESSYQRMRNPVKTYLIDTGLARKVTSPDYGRLLENIVFLELTKGGAEIFYFEDKGECDFIAREQERWSCYQVAWELNEKNKEREMAGLTEACRALNLRKATVLTYDQEGHEKIGSVTVAIKPVWKWLLLAKQAE